MTDAERARIWVCVDHAQTCDCIRCGDVRTLAAEFAAVRAEAIEVAAMAQREAYRAGIVIAWEWLIANGMWEAANKVALLKTREPTPKEIEWARTITSSLPVPTENP